MKNVKIIYLSSCICGVILFIMGLFFLFSIENAQPDISDIKPIDTSNDKSPDFFDNYTDSMEPMNFLILVKEASGDHTDTIIIANYNPSTRQINLLSVPRDTKAGTNASYKVNNAFYLGQKKSSKLQELSVSEQNHKAAEHAAQIISNLTNININYYVYLEIDTIKEIIDKLGGVYFDVPAKLKYTDPAQDLYIDLQKGYQLLDGDKSEQLLRFRKAHTSYYTASELKEYRKVYDGSDLKRTEIQVKFINEMIQQKVSLLQLPKLIPIIGYAFDNVITNTTLNDTLSLLKAFTQGSRPEMNTFKLYGVDMNISDTDYVVYNYTFENTKTKKVVKAQEVIDAYFSSASGNYIPESGKSYNFGEILKNNPSNKASDTKEPNEDIP